MSRRLVRPDAAASAPAVSSNQLERELLARLGLSGDANSLDIQSAHAELTAFLERAPRDLATWARRQIDIADEAYALLSDPTTDLSASTLTVQGHGSAILPPNQLLAVVPEPADGPGGSAAHPAAPASPTASGRISAQQGLPDTGRRIGPVGRALVAAVAVVAFVTVGYAVYASGTPASVPGLTGTPAPEASGQAQVDTARVADLMAKVQADPSDVATLQALGDQYFQAADYATAADWERKVLALEPSNATAMLGLGAAEFNQGNAAEAERLWRAVLATDPKNLEAHYDLGFMYFSQNPPDVAQTTIEWNSVIEIAPDSDIAKTVSTHLKTLETWAASASPAASTAPAASAPPATSASPVASASLVP